jgi:hypothetical protein
MLHAMSRFIWPSGYRGEEFLEIDQSETRISCGGLKEYFPLKPLVQINGNLVGSIYGRSSIKIAHFVLIC